MENIEASRLEHPQIPDERIYELMLVGVDVEYTKHTTLYTKSQRYNTNF